MTMASQRIAQHNIDNWSSIRWSRGEYENPNVKQSNNSGNSWKKIDSKVTETRITTEERQELTNGIRKNKENKA